ncbi:MAG: hypothetical protein ACI9FJ_002567, partial [Alteromonadaceae bacterium]
MLKQLLRTTPKLLKLGVLSVLPLLPLMSVGVQSAT